MEELNKTQEVAKQPSATEQIVTDNAQQKSKNAIPNQEDQDNGKDEAGCLGIGASVLFPIIGVIIYFVQRKEVKNPSAYLYGALGGFIAGLIIRAISGTI